MNKTQNVEITENGQTETQQKPYTLRKLKSSDVFGMLKIVRKIGIDEFKGCFSSPEVVAAVSAAAGEGGETDFSSVGVTVAIDIASVIVSNVPNCEQDIYNFLAQLSGMTPEQIANLDAVVFLDMIVDVIKKDEFKDFIGVVSRLFK